MTQNATEWKPSGKQRAALDAAAEVGFNRTISAVCERANVNRKTFYRWLEHDEDFRSAWESVWRGAVKRHLPGVVMAQIQKALEGDTRAAEYVAKMAGEWVEKKDLTSGGKTLKAYVGFDVEDV
jgi:AcrR family transcriptional regulator